MPQDRLEEARFDHVGENGELVFSSGGRLFAVTVDDALEHAILEAKQLVSEREQQLRQSRQPAALPISQIQSLIRAGADPVRVAERYELSEALVRRFSSAVETEKQYAIEQFLSVPAPKESRVRTLSDLVERTLASAGVGMESVSWRATRRGLEPWHIIAHFSAAGRTVKAEWTWNMHDNSVACLNNTARKLLGEMSLTAKSNADKNTPMPAIPGDSVRSARIERTVSAWNTTEPSLPQALPDADAASPQITPIASVTTKEAPSAQTPSDRADHAEASDPSDHGEVSDRPSSSVADDEAPTIDGFTQPDIMQTLAEISDEEIPREPSLHNPFVSLSKARKSAQKPSAQSASTSLASDPQVGDDDGNADTSDSGTGGHAAEPAAADHESTASTASATSTKPAKRKAGRSAVPSWDEILFGD